MGYKVKWVEDNLGVTRKALRVYEAAGLMPKNKNGQYRDYNDDDIDHIWAFKVFQGMGYSIKEIVTMTNDDEFDFDNSIAQKIVELLQSSRYFLTMYCMLSLRYNQSPCLCYLFLLDIGLGFNMNYRIQRQIDESFFLARYYMT